MFKFWARKPDILFCLGEHLFKELRTLQRSHFKRTFISFAWNRAYAHAHPFASSLLFEGSTTVEYRTTAYNVISADRQFLVGAVATITMNDFVPVGVKVLTGPQICTNHNRTLVVALVNFEITIQVLFLVSFDGSMAQLISSLEEI